MEANQEIKYAYWRTDKAKEEGFSHELISYQTDALLAESDLETLDYKPFPGIDTVLKAIRRNVERIPDGNLWGTRVGNEYKWVSWKDGLELSENFS